MRSLGLIPNAIERCWSVFSRGVPALTCVVKSPRCAMPKMDGQAHRNRDNKKNIEEAVPVD